MTDRSSEDQLFTHIAWRLVPLLIAIFLVAYIDRANIGFAKLQMLSSLRMSEASYGFASSLFFIGYLVCEVPSNLLMHRFGARRWISRIMLTWGVATLLLAWTPSALAFQILRFLLGAAEAGLYPGIILYLGMWFPERQRTGIVGLLTLGSSMGNMLGSLIGGFSLELHGVAGLAGWQWVFLTTGTPALLLTFVTLYCLPDGPSSANFLTAREKDVVESRLRADPPAARLAGGDGWSLAALVTVALFSVGYGTISIAIYGIAYWLPTLVKGFGVTSSVNGMLNMIPWFITSLMLLWLPRRLKTPRRVLTAAFCAALLGILCFVASVGPFSNAVRFAALSLGAPCLYLMIPCFWALPPRLLPASFMKGAGGAAALAVIAAGSSVGGFLAQNIMPWVGKVTGSTSAPMLVPAVSLLLLGTGALVVWVRLGLAGRDGPEAMSTAQ
ncbi:MULTISPECIES: MFS transporter [unclassified Paraburkholderia]|uniref:MFS transporter n=1 Tax=Paraburkholderia sp. BL17N1 TaxID=1938798 RepID=UPI000E3A3595|nr:MULTISPECIES: MFS transporter [unclassified Paraburkholderia]REE22635.1 sugar phosphate permease [Paraburkholderia sp. BL27I4N3]RKR36831.1 sugar phosphate permease [Paraburkholderia sp. BL17N1]